MLLKTKRKMASMQRRRRTGRAGAAAVLAEGQFEAKGDFFGLVECLARNRGELGRDLGELALQGLEAEQDGAHVVKGDFEVVGDEGDFRVRSTGRAGRGFGARGIRGVWRIGRWGGGTVIRAAIRGFQHI